MIVIFGQYNINLEYRDNKKFVYDIVRMKWVVCTPEEEVRQLWLHYLVYDKKISTSKIAVEKGFYINERMKRFDICTFNTSAIPHILIECKAPNQKLDTKVIEQLSRYNLALGAQIFIVTNGLEHTGMEIRDNRAYELTSIY
jgi:hypothetical protein